MWTNRDRVPLRTPPLKRTIGPPRRERRLFGEGDFDVTVAGADDRPRTGLLRGIGRPRFELAEPAGRQSLGVQHEALVEVEVERPDRGDMAAVGGPDFGVDMGRDRDRGALRQLRGRDAAVVLEEDVAGPDDLRFGEGGDRGEKRDHDGDRQRAHQMLPRIHSSNGPRSGGRAQGLYGQFGSPGVPVRGIERSGALSRPESRAPRGRGRLRGRRRASRAGGRGSARPPATAC